MGTEEISLPASGVAATEMAWLEPEAVFAPHAASAGALWLDSADLSHPAGRYSFIAVAPYAVYHLHADNGTHLTDDVLAPIKRELAAAQDLWAALPAEWDNILPPFRGGAAGVFSYELAHDLEKLPPLAPPFAVEDNPFPRIAVGFYDSVVAFDHAAQRVFIIATGLPETTPSARARRAAAAIIAWRRRWAVVTPLPPLKEVGGGRLVDAGFSVESYQQAVAAIIEHILAGDIFQANISQRFRAELSPKDCSFNYYRRLRQLSPSPFAAYACYDGWALASASPERFLKTVDGRVETQPIKGTQPRGKTAAEDAVIARALLTSEKDRAENIMIVDLLRNDLARVCDDASIAVPSLCALESFAQVHHLVSSVTGRLRSGQTPVDLLRACFPGGSVTGAPKIRAMELIARYEPNTRGPYCGAVGYIGIDGRMDVNIAIRTALFKERRLSFQVGGGITVASCPAQEYRETMDKAAGLLAAFGVSPAALQEFVRQ